MQIRFIRLIDELFQSVPQTRETLEMKEEIVQNLMEKYKDLRADGKSEEEAFTIAAASVGDINDIIGGAAESAEPNHQSTTDAPEEAAQGGYAPPSTMSWLQVIAIFAALIVACPFAIRLFKDWRGPFLGLIMLVCAVFLLVNQIATSNRNRVHSAHAHEQVDEEDPGDWEWTPAVENRKLFHSLNSALWTITVAVYFLVSYFWDTWAFSWLIFLITPVISIVLKASLGLTKFRRAFNATFWLMTNVLYFAISFATGAWAITWIIYLIAVSVQNVIKASFELRKGRW